MEIVFERELLFNEVWESPISTLAKKYGLSDNGLRKVCIALSIPLPHRGHWAKVSAGRKIEAPTLVPTTGATQFVSRASRAPTAPLGNPVRELSKDESWLQEMLEFEKKPVNAIVVESELIAPHPAVKAAANALKITLAKLEKARQDSERPRDHRPGQRRLNWEVIGSSALYGYERRGQVIDLVGVPLRVSAGAADRALRIWDALIKACASRGITLSAGGVLSLPGHGAKIHLRLTERVEQKIGPVRGLSPVRVMMKEHIKKMPTGELRIIVGVPPAESKVIDSRARPLEAQLNSVMARAFRQVLANKARATRAEEDARQYVILAQRREEERTTREERARIKQEEVRRQALLIEEVGAWHQSDIIRAYVGSLMESATASGAPITAELRTWLDWATSTAESLDPTKKRLG